jgi:hypothetical protein
MRSISLPYRKLPRGLAYLRKGFVEGLIEDHSHFLEGVES